MKSKKLWKHSDWKKLLHDERSWFGDKSESDSSNFFLYKGKPSYKLELLELTKLASTPVNDDKHPRCRFPARVKWLFDKVNKEIPENFFNSCTQYLRFKKLVEAQSVSIIFSSYYLESPASAFGHTLLKFSRKTNEHSRDSNLLDMGVNYSASVTTDNALLYAFFGLVGLFEGHYSAIPYFYKVREYSDHESRDLWEYRLNLNQEHIDRLQDHLWEVGHTFFYYYYFTENCSYNLLTLLDVANFDLNLRDDLPEFYTIPSHTIKIIHAKKDLVREIKVTPSNRKIFEHHFKLLNDNQKDLLLKAYKRRSLSEIKNSSLSFLEKTQLLDCLMLYVDFKHSADILLGKGDISKWKKRILIYRSQLGTSTIQRDSIVKETEAPHHGHDPRRVMLGFESGRKDRAQFEFRPALHSLMDSSIGQPELATLEFLDLGLSLSHDGIDIEKIDLVEVMALNPITKYSIPFSLKAKFGWINEEIYCQDCTSFNFEAAGGISSQYSYGLAFIFLGLRGLYSEEVLRSHKFIFTPELSFKFNLSDKWSTLFSAKYNRDLANELNYGEFLGELNYYMKKNLRLQFEYTFRVFNEQSVSLNFYIYY